MTSSSGACAPFPLADQVSRAHAFAHLHRDGVLVLPNAWDVGSAVLVRSAGASAVATTSGGMAWSLGAPDGEALARERVLDVVGRVVAAVDCPVTVDVEAGCGEDLDALVATVRGVLAAGAVGLNLEDGEGAGLRDAARQAERLQVVVATAAETGVPLFVNARIDTWLRSGLDATDRLRESIERAHAYVAAGADGVFVPGVLDPEVVRTLVREVPAPLNVMVGPGAPPVAYLADLGVRRVSVGTALAQAAYALTGRAAQEMLMAGTCGAMEDTIDYDVMNAHLLPTRHAPAALSR